MCSIYSIWFMCTILIHIYSTQYLYTLYTICIIYSMYTIYNIHVYHILFIHTIYHVYYPYIPCILFMYIYMYIIHLYLYYPCIHVTYNNNYDDYKDNVAGCCRGRSGWSEGLYYLLLFPLISTHFMSWSFILIPKMCKYLHI